MRFYADWNALKMSNQFKDWPPLMQRKIAMYLKYKAIPPLKWGPIASFERPLLFFKSNHNFFSKVL